MGFPMDLARLYERYAEDCVRSAEKTDNPGRRAVLLKAAEEWRQAAQKLGQPIKPANPAEATVASHADIDARNTLLKIRPETTKKKPAKLRSWRVSILRQRAHTLGTIEAPDAEAAEAEAVKLFGLTEEQRKRLSIWEWHWS
jgi:hypothetical protein